MLPTYEALFQASSSGSSSKTSPPTLHIPAAPYRAASYPITSTIPLSPCRLCGPTSPHLPQSSSEYFAGSFSRPRRARHSHIRVFSGAPTPHGCRPLPAFLPGARPGQASGLHLREHPSPPAEGLPAAPTALLTSTPPPHPTPRGSGPSPTTEATPARHPRSFIVDSKLPKWRRLLPPRKPPPAPTRPLASASSSLPRPRLRPTPGNAPQGRPRPPALPAARPYLRRCPLSWRRRSRRPG